ncbi:MAG TPA: DUF4838 domain-containing protein, partial [bacterium]|nr:DUF4838 domain-containing protein [bacterium]
AKWCQCAQCIRLGDPVERHALMVSQASGAIRRLKRSVKLECIAYSSYVAPPAKRPVRKDILVDFCPINQCFEHQIDDATSERNADYVNHLREWRKRFAGDLSVYSYYRKYAWNSLPILLPHYMQHDLKFYAAEGINGISSYAEPGDWATYELNHYILGALAWNPASDMDSLVEEFAICRFGEFADLGCEAYSLLESRARRFSSIPFTAAKSAEEYDGAIAEFQGLLQRVKWAEEITDSSAVLRVLGRLRFGLEYLLLDIMLTKARVMGEGQTSRLAILSEMDDLLTKASDEGVFLTERLRSTRLASRYGLGDE